MIAAHTDWQQFSHSKLLTPRQSACRMRACVIDDCSLVGGCSLSDHSCAEAKLPIYPRGHVDQYHPIEDSSAIEARSLGVTDVRIRFETGSATCRSALPRERFRSLTRSGPSIGSRVASIRTTTLFSWSLFILRSERKLNQLGNDLNRTGSLPESSRPSHL